MKKILFVVALAVLASLTASAADVREYGVPTRVEAVNPSHGVTHPYHEPKGLKKIYSNLGPSTDAFYYQDGWLIIGPMVDDGKIQWIGYPVTLTRNHTATQLRAAMFNYPSSGGTSNDFNFGIWSDSSGVPGKEINGADKKNLPNWTGGSGDCCKTQNVKIKATSLRKGVQYWMVVSTDKNGFDSSGAWDFDYNTTTGTQAYDLGSGWATEDTDVSAFAWYGKWFFEGRILLMVG